MVARLKISRLFLVASLYAPYSAYTETDNPLSFANDPAILGRWFQQNAPEKNPPEIDWEHFHTGKYNNQVIKIKGTVRDAFRDEIDGAWVYVHLQSGEHSCYVCIKDNNNGKVGLQQLIDAEISAVGVCSMHWGARRMIGYTIYTWGWDHLKIIRSASSNLFDVPTLDTTPGSPLPNLAQMGRRRISGRVIAVWHGDRIMLRTSDNRTVRVDLAEKNAPEYGDLIEVAGRPETDLYRLNLSRGIWRKTSGIVIKNEEPAKVTIRQLTMTPTGERAFQTAYHGRAVQISGKVISVPVAAGDSRLGLESEKQIIPIDAGSCPDAFADVKIGCVIQVSGTCLMDAGNWHPDAPFPHIEEFSIIVRTADDVKILSFPPWWTAGRLLAVIGALLGLLTGITAWNRMLNRRAEKRGKELAEEKVAHITSDLKVYERTRLAVELHDSLSQNLTGVSMAIRAANRIADLGGEGMRQHLALAARTLDSCRYELRNCLWDLRNQTLEETDMNEAIRQTLKPHVGNAELLIRFNVARELFSDHTAHSILRIIRELASNAVRHGGASTIRIAGTFIDNQLIFSVSDNGCGFDPENCPNAASGHFGLQGIQDRVDGYEGEVSIKSAPGAGTKVTVSIKTNNG